jgi:hypothetical protein
MPRLLVDPALETIPDFESNNYVQMRQLLATAENVTQEQAIVILTGTWTRDIDAKKIAWAQQLEADALAQEAEDTAQRLARELELEAERAELLKKRPKMRDFVIGKKISNSIAPRPSTFALNKLENFEYVELWYFSPDGC